MQGYFQISTFHVSDPDDCVFGPNDQSSAPREISIQYAIISRRSKERAGLRYQRRGIDDDAKVANLVETETVIQVKVITLLTEEKPDILSLTVNSAPGNLERLEPCPNTWIQ